MGRSLRIIGAAAAIGLLSVGCQSSRFYRQAIAGHWELMSAREPIMRLIADEAVGEPVRTRLALVQELCAFSETELALPAEGQYTHYVELARPFVVWNVYAAPEFSLEAKSWWYPFVGRLDYQGYFRESLGRDYALKLNRQGWDVYLGPVDAYSTLGWFSDPVLSTFLFLPEPELADLLFHELAHQRLFLVGDTDINEAFATTVAREGVRRWLARAQSPEILQAYREEQRRDDVVVALIQRARQRLEQVYIDVDKAEPPVLRARKQEVFRDLQRDYHLLKDDWPGYEGYDGWMAGELNNARIHAVDAYTRWVPAMESVLRGVEGDLSAFYGFMESLRRMERAERRAVLAWLEEKVNRHSSPAVGSGR